MEYGLVTRLGQRYWLRSGPLKSKRRTLFSHYVERALHGASAQPPLVQVTQPITLGSRVGRDSRPPPPLHVRERCVLRGGNHMWPHLTPACTTPRQKTKTPKNTQYRSPKDYSFNPRQLQRSNTRSGDMHQRRARRPAPLSAASAAQLRNRAPVHRIIHNYYVYLQGVHPNKQQRDRDRPPIIP